MCLTVSSPACLLSDSVPCDPLEVNRRGLAEGLPSLRSQWGDPVKNINPPGSPPRTFFCPPPIPPPSTLMCLFVRKARGISPEGHCSTIGFHQPTPPHQALVFRLRSTPQTPFPLPSLPPSTPMGYMALGPTLSTGSTPLDPTGRKQWTVCSPSEDSGFAKIFGGHSSYIRINVCYIHFDMCFEIHVFSTNWADTVQIFGCKFITYILIHVWRFIFPQKYLADTVYKFG